MRTGVLKTFVAAFGLAVPLAAVWREAPARAQPAIGPVSNFSTSEYFDPPHERQVKVLLTGAEAQPQSGGFYLIKKLKLETFRVSGERELVVESPECFYDSRKGLAGSPGPLQVHSGDARFSIAGEGFAWEQGQGSLIISNKVRSTIQRAVTNVATAASLVITSRWFGFEAAHRSAVFHEQVRGTDPEIEFTCGRLTVHAAPSGQPFEVIEAEESPVIIGKTNSGRAAADRVVYTRSEERVELMGNVAWQQKQQSGRADRAVVHRHQDDAVAEGHVLLKLPRESLAGGGLLRSRTDTPARAEAAGPLVELFAEQFHSRSNLAVAEGAVRLVDGTNWLSCEKLTFRSAAAADETATAEGNVVVEKDGGILRADRAVYSPSDGGIVFTGEPRWTRAQMEGRAERVSIHSDTGEIRARDRVVVKVPLGARRGSLLALFPAPSETNSAPQVVEVVAGEFVAKDEWAVFLGGVRAHQLPVDGSEPRLRSDELEVKFAPGSSQAESLRAQRHVVYEQGRPGETNGPAVYSKLTARTLSARADAATGALSKLVAEGRVEIERPGHLARGERAIYTPASDQLELSGDPWLETPQAIITNARTLSWDNVNGRFAGTGRWKIEFKPEMAKLAAEKLKTP